MLTKNEVYVKNRIETPLRKMDYGYGSLFICFPMSNEEKQNTSKLETLRNIEKEISQRWEQEKIFEVNAPEHPKPRKRKFFTTFPFAYMKFVKNSFISIFL